MKIPHLLVDYGEVIAQAQPEASIQKMAARLTMGVEEFQTRYWAERAEYDRGMPAYEYWELVAGRPVHGSELAELRRLDLESWTRLNFETLDILRSAFYNGARLTLLSNAPRDLADEVSRFKVMDDIFSRMIFSAELRVVKPTPGIFDIALALSEAQPEDTLFIDDRLENLAAAQSKGIATHHFTSASVLRQELQAAGVVPGKKSGIVQRRNPLRTWLRDRRANAL